MSRNLIIGAVVLIVIVGGLVLYLGGQNSNYNSSSMTPTKQEEMNVSPTAMEENHATGGAMMENEASVTIANFAFAPKTLTIKKGTKVTWTNQDSAPHTATADDGSFDTGTLQKGDSKSITFEKAGTFAYHCTVHPNMKASITVE